MTEISGRFKAEQDIPEQVNFTEIFKQKISDQRVHKDEVKPVK